MNSFGSIRVGLLAVLLVWAIDHSKTAIIGWLYSPIGIKEELIYGKGSSTNGQMKFFPAVTICPSADPEFERVISFSNAYASTFKQASEASLTPIVYNVTYMLIK